MKQEMTEYYEFCKRTYSNSLFCDLYEMHGSMKEKLEHLINKLQDEADDTRKRIRTYRDDPYMIGVLDGRHTIATIAINALKEVLADEGEHRTKHHIPTKKET